MWIEVDDEDYDRVNQAGPWTGKRARGRCYAVRNDGGKTIYMHRFIAALHQIIPRGHVVNHLNNDDWRNNRFSENLVVVTRAENSRHYYETKRGVAEADIYNLAREKMRQKRLRERKKRIRAP